MTTTVKIHVNGDYVAKVDVKHANGTMDTQTITGTSEKSFSLAHPASATIDVTERAMSPEEIAERDKPKDPGEAAAGEQKQE